MSLITRRSNVAVIDQAATVSLTPATESPGALTVIDTDSGTINVPADVRKLSLKNVGGINANGLSTVNGVPFQADDDPIELEKQDINGSILTTPAIEVVTTGDRWVGYYFV